jgi:hypothetical protein
MIIAGKYTQRFHYLHFSLPVFPENSAPSGTVTVLWVHISMKLMAVREGKAKHQFSVPIACKMCDDWSLFLAEIIELALQLAQSSWIISFCHGRNPLSTISWWISAPSALWKFARIDISKWSAKCRFWSSFFFSFQRKKSTGENLLKRDFIAQKRI